MPISGDAAGNGLAVLGTLTLQQGAQINSVASHAVFIGDFGVITSSAGDVNVAKTFDRVSSTSGFANVGAIKVADNSTMSLTGDVVNSASGRIELNAAAGRATLELTAKTTVTGGAIRLSDNAKNAIITNGHAITFRNASTVTGSGRFGDGYLKIVNDGVIDGNGAAGLVIIGGVGKNCIIQDINNGLMEATATTSGGVGVLDLRVGDLFNSGRSSPPITVGSCSITRMSPAPARSTSPPEANSTSSASPRSAGPAGSTLRRAVR